MTATATPACTDPGSPANAGSSQTIPAVFFEHAQIYGDREYMHYFRDGEWHSLSWAETAQLALRVACSLARVGLKPGDTVALLSPNRPEWLYCDLGIMAAGGITSSRPPVASTWRRCRPSLRSRPIDTSKRLSWWVRATRTWSR